jgi:hypothetical protein
MTICIHPLCELCVVFFFVPFVFRLFCTTKNTKYITKNTKFEAKLIKRIVIKNKNITQAAAYTFEWYFENLNTMHRKQ